MTSPKAKIVKGWMISTNGGDVAYTVFKSKGQAERMVDEWDFIGAILIPCEIHYHLPSKKRGGKI